MLNVRSNDIAVHVFTILECGSTANGLIGPSDFSRRKQESSELIEPALGRHTCRSGRARFFAVPIAWCAAIYCQFYCEFICYWSKSMKKKLAGFGLIAGVLVAGHAQAQTAEIKVIGKIVPDACQFTIGNGGLYDFGTIGADKLSQDAVTALDAKTQTIAISCNAAAKVALNVRDNRAGTAAGGKGGDDEFGLSKEAKVGFYTLTLSKALGDSNSLDVLAAPAGSSAWALDSTGLMANGSARKSFSDSGSTAPGAYKSISANLTVSPTINKLSELDLSKGGVDLDGSATVELTYL
ncbi:DUF1120 domain-containing protein [Burkholderia contaminans]|uniref:DUF1120 domain-containing protein n=1 Tax=Burkholderia contaminans TaxID=488447 RepID=UPI000AA3672A|nr:DUF1120 domain-containing protein [Burkholderia contaminans]